LNKNPVNMSDLDREFRDLFCLLDNMVDVSLKMKFPSLIAENLRETEDLVKAYVLFNKDIYSNEEQSDIESKIQDFFALQYLGFNQYLKNFRRSLSSSLEEVKDDKNLYQKILKMSEVINSSLKYIDDTQNKFKTILEKDFKSFALTSNIELNSGDEKLKEALSQYLGEVSGKSKTGPYFENNSFSYEGCTWQCEEIKKAFKILKGQSKDERTRVKLAAYADQYKKTFKAYALEEFPSNQANSRKNSSKQATKVKKDIIVKLLQDYLIQNKH
ncbi:MAG: hypothetical protein ACKO3R_08915, partial [bacterium]